jgi:hypothetical protein
MLSLPLTPGFLGCGGIGFSLGLNTLTFGFGFCCGVALATIDGILCLGKLIFWFPRQLITGFEHKPPKILILVLIRSDPRDFRGSNPLLIPRVYI